MQLPMHGGARSIPDWSRDAWDHVHAALDGELGAVDHVFVDPTYPALTAATLFTEGDASPTAPDIAITAPLDRLDDPVEGALSPRLRQYFADLALASGARCVLVVYVARSYPSKGVRSAQVLLVPIVFAMGGLGLADSGARKSASAYLIDPESGVVLWHARHSSGIGDLRDANGASKTIHRLLADLSDTRELPTP
jgi:hypothetical protein